MFFRSYVQTCKNLVDRAFVACDSGILKAQSQCLGVMGALGTVYNHARDVLDRINPERWAKQQQQLQDSARRKRQLTPGLMPLLPGGSGVDYRYVTGNEIHTLNDVVKNCYKFNQLFITVCAFRWFLCNRQIAHTKSVVIGEC